VTTTANAAIATVAEKAKLPRPLAAPLLVLQLRLLLLVLLPLPPPSLLQRPLLLALLPLLSPWALASGAAEHAPRRAAHAGGRELTVDM